MILKLWKNHYLNAAKHYLITIAICFLYPLSINLINALIDYPFFRFLSSFNTLVISFTCLLMAGKVLEISMNSVYGKNTYFTRQIACSNAKLVFSNYFTLVADCLIYIAIAQIFMHLNTFFTYTMVLKRSLSTTLHMIFPSPVLFLERQFGRYGQELISTILFCLVFAANMMFVVAIRHSKFFSHRSSFFSYSVIITTLFVGWQIFFLTCLVFLPGILTYSVSNGNIVDLKMVWVSVYNLSNGFKDTDLSTSIPLVGIAVPLLIIYIAQMFCIHRFACKKFNICS